MLRPAGLVSACQKSDLLLRFWELGNFVLWTFPLSKMTVFSLLLHIFTTNVSKKKTHRTQQSPTGDAQYVIERCFVSPKLSKVHFISVFSKFHKILFDQLKEICSLNLGRKTTFLTAAQFQFLPLIDRY